MVTQLPRPRPATPRPLLALVALTLLALVAACSGEAALPSGPELMKKTAEAMKSVKSAAFAITTEGTPQVPLRKADGRLTAAGDADGTLSVELFGQLTEMSFVLLGDTVYFKGPTGGFQTMTRQTLMQTLSYDPSQILDPSKGLAQILTTAANPSVDGEEGGAYRVTAALRKDVLKSLVPGVNQDVNAQFLIDKATSRINRITLPLQGGSAAVALSEYDAAVQITPPPAG